MHIDDAAAFIVDVVRNPRGTGYSNYGYDLFLPNVIRLYLQEVERIREDGSSSRAAIRTRELACFFYEAAWDFCRRGVLRPGLKALGEQSAGLTIATAISGEI